MLLIGRSGTEYLTYTIIYLCIYGFTYSCSDVLRESKLIITSSFYKVKL